MLLTSLYPKHFDEGRISIQEFNEDSSVFQEVLSIFGQDHAARFGSR